jgi:hypothetical protein
VKEKAVITDKPLAISLFCIGAAMYIFSFFFRESKYTMFGSRTETLPRICAVLIMAFSVILFIQAVMRDRIAEGKISGIVEQLKEDKAVYIMFCLTGFYIFLFTRLGFMTSTFLYTIAATFLLGRGKIRWYTIVIIALTISVSSYLFFAKLLNVILPQGLLI